MLWPSLQEYSVVYETAISGISMLRSCSVTSVWVSFHVRLSLPVYPFHFKVFQSKLRTHIAHYSATQQHTGVLSYQSISQSSVSRPTSLVPQTPNGARLLVQARDFSRPPTSRPAMEPTYQPKREGKIFIQCVRACVRARAFVRITYVQYMCVCCGINTKLEPTENFMAVYKLQPTWRKYATVISFVWLTFIPVNLLIFAI
jgi:hypothetical protein